MYCAFDSCSGLTKLLKLNLSNKITVQMDHALPTTTLYWTVQKRIFYGSIGVLSQIQQTIPIQTTANLNMIPQDETYRSQKDINFLGRQQSDRHKD